MSPRLTSLELMEMEYSSEDIAAAKSLQTYTVRPWVSCQHRNHWQPSATSTCTVRASWTAFSLCWRSSVSMATFWVCLSHCVPVRYWTYLSSRPMTTLVRLTTRWCTHAPPFSRSWYSLLSKVDLPAWVAMDHSKRSLYCYTICAISLLHRASV